MSRIVIEEAGDTARLKEALAADRVKNAYPIGAMAAGYVDQSQWFWALDEGQPQGILTIYGGLSAPAVFSWGTVEMVSLLVSRLFGKLPDRLLLHRYPEHAAAFSECLRSIGTRRVVRMSLKRDDFKPETVLGDIQRLSHGDTSDLMQLYTSYPDNFFEPYQLETGYYFGIREHGELVCGGGVHIVDPDLRFSMLGNIVTASHTRGKGYAKAITSLLCAELLEFSDLLILDVPMETGAAFKVFSKLGFRAEFRYEQILSRKNKNPAW